MGGKGRRRREKNYRAAHGGPIRLPPPPDPSQDDTLPSKLRKLISFTSTFHGSTKISNSKDAQRHQRNSREDADTNSRRPLETKTTPEATGIDDEVEDEHLIVPQVVDTGDEMLQNSKTERRKKKRKRKEVKDLRFEDLLDNSGTGSKRKERKKQYFEEKKKKHKKSKTEQNLDFPGREIIKFGDVVEAPPKLLAIPKALKTDASKERLRLQAIESYRNRKGWTSRPGLQLPSMVTPPSL